MEITYSYIRSKVSDGELFNFYKKYMALKTEIKDLEKELEAYKVEALDKDGPTNERIYLMETILKNAFTHMYDAYKDLLSVKPYDPDYKEGYRV